MLVLEERVALAQRIKKEMQDHKMSLILLRCLVARKEAVIDKM